MTQFPANLFLKKTYHYKPKMKKTDVHSNFSCRDLSHLNVVLHWHTCLNFQLLSH